jgi:ribosomal-protein-alanine N-acetyltransferase
VTEVSPFPILLTKRLTLRAIAPADAVGFRTLMSVPDVTRYANWPENPTDDQADAWTRNLSDLFPTGNGCAWVIEERSSGAFVGAVHFNYFYRDWKLGGIGYEIHPDYWGRGLTTEALRAVVAHGHGFFALSRIEAWTLPGNAASDRVLEKAGFQFEGVFRQKGFFKGAFHDFRMFGRLASDAVMPGPVRGDRAVAVE